MLSSLIVQNFVLIEQMEVRFTPGFTAITGETGAGKSILVGAISLLQGRRADSNWVRQGAKKSVVEGHFIDIPESAKELLADHDLSGEDGQCIVRREISLEGRSRCFINDTPTTVGILGQLTRLLLDIHSQHQNLLLSEKEFQLSIVDKMLDKPELISDYATRYRRFKQAHEELVELQEQLAQAAEAFDFDVFRLKELEEAQLEESDELERLEEEATILQHADEIKNTLIQVSNTLGIEEPNAIALVETAARRLTSISGHMEVSQGLASRLESCRVELEDIRQEVEGLGSDIEADPVTLHSIEQRIDQLNTLINKHRVSHVAGLIDLRAQLQQRVDLFQQRDDILQRKEEIFEKAHKELIAAGEKLSAARRCKAKEIALLLEKDLQELEIPHARIEIGIAPLKDPVSSGLDEATFLFSANLSEPVHPIADIASGGEMARLMLALKALLSAKTSLPTVLFDEIDTGVSGKVADRMGAIMRRMGKHMQVIAITHLPQIAARADSQMNIVKEVALTGATTTHLTSLDSHQRVNEIARLISGDSISNAAIAAAQALLEQT